MPGHRPHRRSAPSYVREVPTDYGGGLTMTVGHRVGRRYPVPSPPSTSPTTVRPGPWRDVVAPAEVVARHGFPLGSAAGYYLTHVRDSVFAWDPETVGRAQRDDGAWVEPGDTMLIDGLARDVGPIAEHGASTMYDGELAAAITADVANRGGLLTAADLSAYQPVVRRRSRRAQVTGSCAPTLPRQSAAPSSPRCSRCSATARAASGPLTTWPTSSRSCAASSTTGASASTAPPTASAPPAPSWRGRSGPRGLRQHRPHLRRRLDRRRRARSRHPAATAPARPSRHRPVAEQLPRRA